MESTDHPRVRALATPLACANTTVLKISGVCPATHQLMGEVFPDGAVNVITYAPADAGPIVNALIAHPAMRRITFTSSKNGIRSGMCHIHGSTVRDEAQMPFDGTKASGYGRCCIDFFTRWITIETAKRYCGPGGTLQGLANLPGRRNLPHISNSNPILLADSAERREVEAAGFEVAYDGMEVQL